MRSEKSIKNIAVGVVMQAVYIITGFVTRTVLIHEMGVTIAGLGNLFTEVIAILSMAELGVGSAITYSMYKPVAEGDEDRICRLMTLYRDTYRVIAACMLGLGLLLLPVVPYLIKDVDVPIAYVQAVYLLYVAQTAGSYLLAYKSAILDVSQNQYIASGIRSVMRLLQCVICVLVLRCTHDYLIYLGTIVVITLLDNGVIALVANRLYPYLKNHPKLPKEERKSIFQNIKHLFIGKLSAKITYSTDNVLISVMVSTAQVGYYGNYAMLVSSARRIADQIGQATVGSVGNMMVTETGEKCSDIIRRMTFVFFFIASFAGCLLVTLLTPLVTLWLGPSFTLPTPIIFVCVYNFFLQILRTPVWNMITPSGIFRSTKYVSILGSVVNLVVSVVLTLRWGMIGIFLGTTCTLVIQLALDVALLWKKALHISPWRIGKLLLAMAGLGAGEMALCWFLCRTVLTGNLYVDFLLKLLISSAAPLLVNYLLYRKTSEFQYLRWLTRKTLARVKAKLRSRAHKA